MSIEEAMMGGIVFKGKKDKPKEENKDKDQSQEENLHYRATRFRLSQNESRNPPQNALTDIRNDKYSLIACRQGPDGRSHSRLL